MWEWEKFLGVLQVAAVSQIAAVIFGEDRQCWNVPWQVTGERSFFSTYRVLSVCGRLPKRARKNSSLEEDGINALCPLVGQCVAETLCGGIDSREKIDLWLLYIYIYIYIGSMTVYIYPKYIILFYWYLNLEVNRGKESDSIEKNWKTK